MTRADRLRKGVWLALAVVVLWFAPLALTYSVPAFTTQRHSWEDQLLGWVLGSRFAFGPGSGLTGAPAALMAFGGKLWLAAHTVAGAAVIVLGVLQFSARLRARRRGVHRAVGIGYVCCSLVTVAGAMALLARTPLADTFSGPGYGLWLWVLAVITAAGTVAAFLAARRRSFFEHQAWAAYSFAMLMSAPLLRLSWIVVGLFWHTSKEELNRFTELWMVPLLIICALAATRLRVPDAARLPARTGRLVPPWRVLAVLAVITAGCLACVNRVSTAAGPGVPEMLRYGFAVPLVGAIAGFVTLAVLAHRAGRRHASAVWRLQAGAALLVAPCALVAVPFLQAVLPRDDALLAAASFAWIVACSAGYLLAIPAVRRPSGPRAPSRDDVPAPAPAELVGAGSGVSDTPRTPCSS